MEFLLLYERVLLRMCIMRRRLKNKPLDGIGRGMSYDNEVLCMAFFFLFSFFYLEV